MRITESIKISGIFWSPRDEKKKFAGELTIKNGGVIELRLQASRGAIADNMGLLSSMDIIVGVLPSDITVSLIGCKLAWSELIIVCDGPLLYAIQSIVIGRMITLLSELQCHSLEFTFDGINEWIGVSGISSTIDKGVTYVKPREIAFDLDNGLSVAIYHQKNQTISPVHSECSISQQTVVRIYSTTKRYVKDLIDCAESIIELVCLSCDSAISMTGAFVDETYSNYSSLAKGRLYYQSKPFNEQFDNNVISYRLFDYATIKGSSGLILNKWIELSAKAKPAINLYVMTKVGGFKYLEGELLALAQALEVIHRKTSTDVWMDKGQYKSILNDMMKECPREYQEAMRQKTEHGYELTFGDRLKRLSEPFIAHFQGEGGRDCFVKKVKSIRNGLTHYADKWDGKVRTDAELLGIYNMMKALFLLTVFREVGFDDILIKNIVDETDNLRGLLPKRERPNVCGL